MNNPCVNTILTDKYLAEQGQNEEVSECCGAEVTETIDYDECSDCKEACRVITLGEYNYEARQSALEDAHDV